MKLWLALSVLLFSGATAHAGAWTEPKGDWQIISDAILSDADRAYDGQSAGRTPVDFRRALFQTSADYGWNDYLTLFARLETAVAHYRDPYTPAISAVDNAAEIGTRLRLMDDPDDGILSLEGSLRTAGAFNFAVSANSLAAGRSAGLRLLYGRNFQWQGLNGFLDFEIGETFLSRPRPNETPIDLTAGLWIDGKTMAMLQSFNLIGAGGGSGDSYPYFRSHKLEVSLVRKLSARYSLQAGAFFSPAGQNALVEQGLCLSLWTNF
jgi:hypothetical protein